MHHLLHPSSPADDNLNTTHSAHAQASRLKLLYVINISRFGVIDSPCQRPISLTDASRIHHGLGVCYAYASLIYAPVIFSSACYPTNLLPFDRLRAMLRLSQNSPRVGRPTLRSSSRLSSGLCKSSVHAVLSHRNATTCTIMSMRRYERALSFLIFLFPRHRHIPLPTSTVVYLFAWFMSCFVL